MADQSEKAAVKWGYILEAAGRPSLKRQRECIALHGVDMGQYGPLWHDKLTDRTTRYRARLTEREGLVQAVQRGDQVVVAGIECLGGSRADVDWFLGEMAERGVSVIVNGGSIKVEPGGDRSEIVEAVGKFQKAQHQRAWRSK